MPDASSEAVEQLASLFSVRDRFSVKWLARIIGPYVVWYSLMLFFLWRFPEFRDAGTVPLAAMIASPTLITLAVLIPILNGIHRRERQETDLPRMTLGMIQGGAGNGS